jgi:hypothetical protein
MHKTCTIFRKPVRPCDTIIVSWAAGLPVAGIACESGDQEYPGYQVEPDSKTQTKSEPPIGKGIRSQVEISRFGRNGVGTRSVKRNSYKESRELRHNKLFITTWFFGLIRFKIEKRLQRRWARFLEPVRYQWYSFKLRPPPGLLRYLAILSLRNPSNFLTIWGITFKEMSFSPTVEFKRLALEIGKAKPKPTARPKFDFELQPRPVVPVVIRPYRFYSGYGSDEEYYYSSGSEAR